MIKIKEKNKDVYFAHPIDTYNNKYEKDCIELIKNIIIPNKIINPNSKFFQKKINDITKNHKNGILEHALNREVFFPAIDSCNIFVYALTEKNTFTQGVKKELDYILNRNKRFSTPINKKMYKLLCNGNKIEIIEMNKDNRLKMAKNNIGKNKEWVLKTTDDYKLFYEINPEIEDFINSQIKYININDEIIQQGVVPHLNSVFETNNFEKILINCICKEHKTTHGFIDPGKQQKVITCPYTGIGSLNPLYSGFKVDNIQEINLHNLLLQSRVLHKTMYLYDKAVFTKGQGIHLFDDKGNRVPRKGAPGKFENDYRKVQGVEPLYDLDCKKGLLFFDKPVFKQYMKAIELTEKFIYERWDIENPKLGFSGNGIYIIMPELLLSDYKFNFQTFEIQLKDSKMELHDIFKKNGINNVNPDRKAGWGAYFKLLGSFHGERERLSIPLNINESLDYEWMDNITKIETGLDGNVFKEIIKRANWR